MKEKYETDTCPLCGSDVSHNALDEGEDELFCSKSECPLGQVNFTSEEWGKLSGAGVGHG